MSAPVIIVTGVSRGISSRSGVSGLVFA